jgi:hypothetical protein
MHCLVRKPMQNREGPGRMDIGGDTSLVGNMHGCPPSITKCRYAGTWRVSTVVCTRTRGCPSGIPNRDAIPGVLVSDCPSQVCTVPGGPGFACGPPNLRIGQMLTLSRRGGPSSRPMINVSQKATRSSYRALKQLPPRPIQGDSVPHRTGIVRGFPGLTRNIIQARGLVWPWSGYRRPIQRGTRSLLCESRSQKILRERPKGLTMEGLPKAGIFVAILVLGGSLYCGWQGTSLGAVAKESSGTNLGKYRTVKPTAVREASRRLSVLYVMDPSVYSFEYVKIDNFTNDTVVGWMRGLRDALTATVENPCGSPLMVIHKCFFCY